MTCASFMCRAVSATARSAREIPADFSSATFFLCAGALGANDIICRGLDMNDTQGDKAVVAYLQAMGAQVQLEEADIRVSARQLRGCEIDLNATPDALPMMAVLACFAMGQTRLVNVPQARMKETDRIAVMAHELVRMGAQVKELKDGLIIHESPLRSARVHGHDDHRVVMALAVAGLMATGGETAVETAEAMEVTYPGFVSDMQQLGSAGWSCWPEGPAHDRRALCGGGLRPACPAVFLLSGARRLAGAAAHWGAGACPVWAPPADRVRGDP